MKLGGGGGIIALEEENISGIIKTSLI